MKKHLLILFFLFAWHYSYLQNEADKLHFEININISFNSGSTLALTPPNAKYGNWVVSYCDFLCEILASWCILNK